MTSSVPSAAYDTHLPQSPGPGGEPGFRSMDQQFWLHRHSAHHTPRPRDQRQLSHRLPRGPTLLRLPLVPACEVPQQVSNSQLLFILFIVFSYFVVFLTLSILGVFCRKNWYLPAPEVSPSSPVEFSLLSKEETSWGTIKMTFSAKGQQHVRTKQNANLDRLSFYESHAEIRVRVKKAMWPMQEESLNRRLPFWNNIELLLESSVLILETLADKITSPQSYRLIFLSRRNSPSCCHRNVDVPEDCKNISTLPRWL